MKQAAPIKANRQWERQAAGSIVTRVAYNKKVMWLVTRQVMQRSARSIFQLSRREREFLIFNLAHRDETENFCHLISCFETRPRIISFNLRHRDEIENFHDLFSVFETRTRNFDIAISSREIGFCSTFLHANLVKYFLSDPSGPGVWYMSPAIYLSLKGLTISQNFCGITKEFFAS